MKLHFVICLCMLPAGAFAASEPAIASALDDLPLPGIYRGERTFKVDPYLVVAARLQKAGQQEAIRHLADFALRQSGMHDAFHTAHRAESLYVLCRMLFVARGEEPFRRPRLGGPAGDAKREPLEPIHIADGVPFLTFKQSYILGGAPEGPTNYLLYCVSHCDWSPVRFLAKAMQEKEAALEKLLATNAHLRGMEEDLREQIDGW